MSSSSPKGPYAHTTAMRTGTPSPVRVSRRRPDQRPGRLGKYRLQIVGPVRRGRLIEKAIALSSGKPGSAGRRPPCSTRRFTRSEERYEPGRNRSNVEAHNAIVATAEISGSPWRRNKMAYRAWVGSLVLACAAFGVHADETCNSPYIEKLWMHAREQPHAIAPAAHNFRR